MTIKFIPFCLKKHLSLVKNNKKKIVQSFIKDLSVYFAIRKKKGNSDLNIFIP